MEALYKKLYDKFVSLKKEKASPLDEINQDQEVKFLNFVSAAEDLIQHLKDDNSQLRAEVRELKFEVTSIRSKQDEERAEHQKLLLEESEKRKMLSDEVERLQKQLNESSHLVDEVSIQLNNSLRRNAGKSNSGIRDAMDQCTPTPGPSNQLLESDGLNNSDQITTHEVSNGSMRIMTRKRSREAKKHMEAGIAMHGSDGQSSKRRRKEKSASNSSKVASGLCSVQLPTCCKTSLDKSGTGACNDGDPTNCRFQALMEYLIGMKLSAVHQTDGVCISALHQTSGYSFSLTWVKNSTGRELELLYRASTLGTFERVAPEWMRSMITFSISMCPIFFARVSRVIKLHHH
ncbi:unnamed protein product [Linum tenue]|uniref:DUF7806 domain-containing protein n=1 Tax=Linum tenue TaxID=586396 RepID=A0AAV0J975_9ROSI|nr:unnamed protein product [Linum tenue]